MATFLTIGYGDEQGYKRTAPDVRQAAHEHDATQVRTGVIMGRAGTPVQVRNPDDAGVQTSTGAFLRAALPVAGFSIIEADSLDAAVEQASHSPCAVAHGVIEVWPLERE